MDKKSFKSKLFGRMINPEEKDYWSYLYADILYRIKELKDLNCPCSFCCAEKVHFENLLEKIENDFHIKQHPKASKFTGQGDCGRRLNPIA